MAPLNFFGAYHQRGGAGADRLPSVVVARWVAEPGIDARSRGNQMPGRGPGTSEVSPASVIALPRKDSIRGTRGSAFDLQGLLIGIDFHQWLGHFKVDIV
jgi:hypothetical protein